MNALVPVILGLIVLIAMGMVVVLMKNNEAARKQRALSVIKGRGGADSGGPRNEKDAQNKRRAEIAKKLKESGEAEDKPKKNNTAMLLEHAGMSISPQKFWIFSAVFGLVAVLLSKFVFHHSIFVVLMVALTAFLGLPRLFLNFKIKRRQKKFLEEFADALEAMVRLLKAGMPVTEAIKMAGREFEGPVGEEMGRIYDAQKVGIPLPEATLIAAKRMPITEVQMFATAVAIQQQTGSSLSEILLNLAGVIRARFRLRRKVQALSSEAKSSAMIIGALPFLIGGGLYLINPEYIGILFTSGTGKFLLVGAGVWMSIGIMIMKIMINFKI